MKTTTQPIRIKRHKHTYTVEVNENSTARTSEISMCPVNDYEKCIKYELRKRK